MASKNYENALAKGDGGVAGMYHSYTTYENSTLTQ